MGAVLMAPGPRHCCMVAALLLHDELCEARSAVSGCGGSHYNSEEGVIRRLRRCGVAGPTAPFSTRYLPLIRLLTVIFEEIKKWHLCDRMSLFYAKMPSSACG